MATRQAKPTRTNTALQELARLYGLQTTYDDATGRRQEISPDSLIRVLQILGAPLRRAAEAPGALRERRQALWRHALEPVSVAWDGRADGLTLRLPERQAAGRVRCCLLREDGAELAWEAALDDLPARESAEVEGVTYVAKALPLPGEVHAGYHRLEVAADGGFLQTLLVSAPRRAYAPPAGERTWGVFLPLYALRTERGGGAGDFTDLGRLLDWVHGLGGGVVGTLPLTAAFLDEPLECSPYSPASRLFWNEFYLDVEALPELAECPEARALLADADFARETAALRALPHVEYRREMARKRRVLAELARSFFRSDSVRRGEFERWRAARPEAEAYARFRAVGERLRRPWPEWPAPLRDGTIGPGDFDEAARDYHLYAQWAAEGQMQALAARARRAGPGLYLDLPLGVSGHGYDVWREREAFAVEASGGCPPDTVFPAGQDWGFPPLHPDGIRARGYRYVLAYLRQQLKYAGILRIDHMPVFHRLWWVPRGASARDGVYVRYPAEELYALFSLESHRHKAMLVGEDLGTVPPEVPESMARHNVHRMYVIQYALTPDPKAALPPVPADSVASVNNHDMPPFAAYWSGADIGRRQQLGLLGGLDPDKEREQRAALLDALVAFLRRAGRLDEADDSESVLRACLAHLAASGPRVTLVSLEDLWGETEPQNTPSTGEECANWRRKARYSLEEFGRLPAVVELLRSLDGLVRAPSAL